jgi:hypothetical protein
MRVDDQLEVHLIVFAPESIAEARRYLLNIVSERPVGGAGFTMLISLTSCQVSREGATFVHFRSRIGSDFLGEHKITWQRIPIFGATFVLNKNRFD